MGSRKNPSWLPGPLQLPGTPLLVVCIPSLATVRLRKTPKVRESQNSLYSLVTTVIIPSYLKVAERRLLRQETLKVFITRKKFYVVMDVN